MGPVRIPSRFCVHKLQHVQIAIGINIRKKFFEGDFDNNYPLVLF